MDSRNRPPLGKSHRPISGITIVDSLAEITRYQDRELLETSLAITLSELFPAESFKLFRVAIIDDQVKAALAVYAKDGALVSNPSPEQGRLAAPLLAAVTEAIEQHRMIERTDADAGLTNVIYPLFDKHGEVSDIVLQITAEPEPTSQHLTDGLLRIYSNYLVLLDDSHRDRLTNLLNRQTLDGEITKHLIHNTQDASDAARKRRAGDTCGTWFSLIDIDHFKRINDTWGHLYGDEVLILLARLLEQIFRSEDLIFRYGGEEFIVLFRAPSLADAASVCERMRRTIADYSFPTVGTVTVSVGVTQVCEQQGVAMVIDEADKALYYAKEHGRDQVRFYARLISEGLIEQPAPGLGTPVDFF